MKTHLTFLRPLCALLTAFTLVRSAHAQWETQSMTLKPGWNAVYLHVDASHVTLDNLITSLSNPIAEVWLWQPPVSTLQFVDTPAVPSAPNSQWAVWNRSPVVADTLTKLVGNAAYLVNNTNSVDFVWTITGKPVAPRYQWTTSGLNFIGFPTPTNGAPNFDNFLSPVPEFQHSAEIYRYPGGALGSNNPVRVNQALFRNTIVTRGQAFWIRAGTAYNSYYSPVEVSLQNAAGVSFGNNLGTYSVRLKNLTATNCTVTLNLLASGTPPPGQESIVGTPPLLVRGPLNTTNLTYTYAGLTNQQSFTLTPVGQDGSNLEVVLGLNRSAMTAPTGSNYAGILRFADTGGLEQIDVPVTATVADTSGLWVGEANVTQVGQYLKTYQRDNNGLPVLSTISTNGAPYVSTGTNTSLGAIARPFSLRLILHNDGTNNVNLLQRVYYGQRYGTNLVIATRESFLDATNISSARRISAAHLPFALTNAPWPKTSGAFQLGTNLVFNVTLDYNDHASNPFLHTFHPDHDNLKSDFKTVEDRGNESYTVTRQITLAFTAPAGDFASLTTGTRACSGDYAEVITFQGLGGQSRSFYIVGTFTINRLSSIATLTTN